MPANLSANVTVGPAEGSVDVQHLSCGHKVVSSELLLRKQLLFRNGPRAGGPSLLLNCCGIVQDFKHKSMYMCIYFDVCISECEQ